MGDEAKITPKSNESSRRDTWRTLAISLLSGAAIGLIVQLYGTFNESHAWHREQRLKTLESAVQKALEAKAAVFEQTANNELLRAFAEDIADQWRAANEAEAGRYAALNALLVRTDPKSLEAFKRIELAHERTWMLLFEAELSDGSNKASKAYDAWSTAVVRIGAKSASESLGAKRLTIPKDEQQEIQALAGDVRAEVTYLTGRAMERLRSYRGM